MPVFTVIPQLKNASANNRRIAIKKKTKLTSYSTTDNQPMDEGSKNENRGHRSYKMENQQPINDLLTKQWTTKLNEETQANHVN